MVTRRKAVRWMEIVCGTVWLMVLGGCSQPQVVRETVVVVATATSLAPATIQPAMNTPTAESVTATPQPAATSAETAAAPTSALATAAPAQPTQVPTATSPTAEAPTAEPPTAEPPTPEPPTAEPPTTEPTVPPVAWNELPVLLSAPFLPAGGNLIVLSFSPLTFSGPTLPVAVRFRIVDPSGQVVFEGTDNNAPWCALGDSPTGCGVLTMGNATWPSGLPALAGRHTLLMTATDAQQRAIDNQSAFDLNYAWGELPALGTTAIVPQGGTLVPVLLHVSPANFAGARPQRVVFTVLDPNGNRVFERVDGDSPWCAFGDADTVSNCKPIRFEKPEWPSGQPLMLGRHTLTLRADDAQGGTQTKRVTFNVEMLPRQIENPTPAKPVLPKLTVVAPQKAAPIEEPIQLKHLRLKGDLEMQLIYPEKARGTLMIYLLARSPGASAIGEGVSKIEFAIFDANDILVNQEQESTPAFCAFGGNDPCNAIALKQGAVWPSTGIPIQTGPYTVQVTVWGKDQNGNLTGPWRGRARFDVIVPGQN